MSTIRVETRTDDQGRLQIEVPQAGPHRRVEVMVTWTDDARPSAGTADRMAAWKIQLDALFGSARGLGLERPEQPLYEERPPIA